MPSMHAPDRINLINSMQGFYAEAAGIPSYINMLRAPQINHCKHITNWMLVDIATAAVDSGGGFERAGEDWERKPKDEQTWAN